MIGGELERAAIGRLDSPNSSDLIILLSENSVFSAALRDKTKHANLKYLLNK
jgi:hypothetical protein